MIEVKFIVDSHEQLLDEMAGFILSPSQVTIAPPTTATNDVELEHTQEHVPAPAAKEEKPKPAKKKKGRPPKDPSVKVDPDLIKKSAVSDALQELNVGKGLKVCKDLLADFECKKVGELPEDKYKDFIDACKEALEG